MNKRMRKFGSELDRVLPEAARAAQEALAAGMSREQAEAIFAFTRDCGFLDATDLLPPRHLTRAEFDALPVFTPGDAISALMDDTADEWCRSQIVGTWIVLNFKEGCKLQIFKPEIGGPSSPLN
jgi:hypothetical protein